MPARLRLYPNAFLVSKIFMSISYFELRFFKSSLWFGNFSLFQSWCKTTRNPWNLKHRNLMWIRLSNPLDFREISESCNSGTNASSSTHETKGRQLRLVLFLHARDNVTSFEPTDHCRCADILWRFKSEGRRCRRRSGNACHVNGKVLRNSRPTCLEHLLESTRP